MDVFGKLSRFVTSIVKEESQEEEIFKLIDSLLTQLSSLENHPWISENTIWADHIVEKIQSCRSGLTFLRLFFWSTSMLENIDADIMHMLIIPLNHAWGIQDIEDWILDLQGRIQYCKQKFQQSKVDLLLGYSLRCNPLEESSTVDFLADILQSLKDLSKFKTGDEALLLNDQIATLESKVTLLHNLFSLTPVEWRDFKEMRAFNVVVNVFAQYSASLVFLYWVKAIDEDMAAQLNVLLLNVLHKYRPCVPVFKDVYIRFLKEIKFRRLDSLLLGQIIQIFLDLLLENLVDILKDDFLNFQESLTFLISFLANPRDEHEEDREWMTITAEIEVLVKKDLYLVKEKVDINSRDSKANAYLSELKRNVEQVKGKILQTYDRIRDPFSYDFPKINGLGFFDFLLQNLSLLKEKLKRDTNFIPFAKHLIIQIEEELMSLRPYLDDLFERQKEDEQLKDTWLKVIDLAYQSEYAINSCMVTGNPLWYNMAGLMEILDKLKDVKKIEGRKTRDGAILHCSAVAPINVPEGLSASRFNDGMVGLEEEAEKIVGNLINGSKSFDIVAIVGMPGIGKTTMANKVYNAPIVRGHFLVFAYCIVSQVYSTKRILLDILGDARGMDDNMYEMTDETDLAHMLYKSLSGRRYLIILDDIWDVKPWDKIKSSLPNDQNGSRVIFTTRNRNVALLAKEDCILHHLPFLSDEESWEFLRKKAFPAEDCPQDFQEVGKMIAKNCKGLPLTIVSIVDPIAQSETLSSYVSTRQCIGVLESSYQHLPEHLKPCFLYFGAIAEDRSICVNKLMLLWIAEGFVQKSNMTNLEKVARAYLCELVDRSLVIPDERSSYGEIKSCRIHDLVREFCQTKAQQENIFQLMVNNEASSSSSSAISNPYRVSIHMKEKDLSVDEICPDIRSLLINRITFRDAYHNIGILKLVQVMSLERLEWDTDLITRVIASLVHLRFIATSIPTEGGITVPSSISNLWKLETLIFTGKRSILFKLELPGTFWTMTRLKHVDFGMCNLSSVGLKKGETYPQMVNLESFSSPYFSSMKDLEDLLQRSPSLQKLSFHYGPSENFHFPKLDSLSKLESLKVSSARDPSIHSFKSLSSLKKLSLSDCCLNWKQLPVISKIMPCLEVLKLLDNSFVWKKWDMQKTEFPELKFLKLQGLQLAEWIGLEDSFPQLEVLIVNRCSNLDTIPGCFEELSTLKRIGVYASPKATLEVVKIKNAQVDIGNKNLQVVNLQNAQEDYEFPE